MKKVLNVAAVLVCLLLSTAVLAQTVNATLGGTVADPSGALIPGVTITATNTGTGIVSTLVTNESGSYSFASLQPGTYKLSAALPGFQTETFTDVALGGAQQVRINFTLKVAGTATNVEVAISADTLLATSSNSVGTTLPEYKLRDLPVQTRNVFNLVANTPGVQSSGGTIGIMAGGRLGDVNATRDGVNVNDGRYENGAWSVVFTSADMVEEVKIVVAPVDAETSRGSGQVAMVTRSGTNTFHGSAAWTNHNSALDTNNWFNNQTGVSKSYDNRNQMTARLAGPIIRNKTFFFVLYEGQRDIKRTQASGLTFTDMAKAGIFRYWPGVDNNNANNSNPSVDRLGNPIAPVGATGPLAAIDMLGNCTFNGAPVANCQTYRDPAGSRTAISTVPFIQEQLKRMPSPNEFTGGDGLNTANIRFVRRQEGLDLTNGNGDEVNRDQYNARIDHNFNSNNRVSLLATKEKTWATATQAGLRGWPQGYDGLAVKRPYLYSIQLSSTISSTLLNQLRLSKRASNNWQWGSADRNDEIGAEARKLHASANGIPYQVTFATGIPSFSNIGGFGRWREGINPMKSVGDDLSWSHGKHAFKLGIEWRRQESNGFNDPNYDPVTTLGSPNALALTGLTSTQYPGLNATPATLARNILYDLTGSVANINQAFGVVSSSDTRLQSTPVIRNNRHWNYQSEVEWYLKDEWKFRSNLTLNLGVHWAWYGNPWEHDGLAARIIGDSTDVYSNVKCTSSPGTIGFTSTCTDLVEVQFVGKNSPNPNLKTNLKGNDLNNFAPSVGFSWNVPWFSDAHPTVVRAGYGMNYEGALRNFINVDGDINTVPGINLVSGGSGRTYNPSSYLSLAGVTLPIPLATGTPTTAPFLLPTTDRSLEITTYDNVSPYTQNWNFEIQRQVAKDMTVEVRYIGSKGTKRTGNYSVNAIAGLGRNRELFDAFNIVRSGGESTLFNTMLMGANLGGVINATTYTGSMALRTNTTTRADLANGNVGTLINRVNTSLLGGDNGTALRRAGYAENYIVPSPQYSLATVLGNLTNSTYHAMQLQFTKRLKGGFSNTTTWTFSKAMGPGTDIDPDRRGIEKSLQTTDVMHQITSNGTYELPFGIGHSLLGNAPGWVQHIVNKWQLGGIMNYNTGNPISITSGIATISTTGAKPNQVGEIPKDMGKITKLPNGVTYFDGYTQIADPSFTPTTANGLNVGYTNKAILDPDGNLILVNPQPGELGTLGFATLRGPGALRFDLNMVKRFRIQETKEVEFRVDVINVLNHPVFGNPSTAINSSGNFGRITTATGTRSFITNLRFNF